MGWETLKKMKRLAVLRSIDREDSVSDSDGDRGIVEVESITGKYVLRVQCFDITTIGYYIGAKTDMLGSEVDEEAARTFLTALERE